MAAASFERSVAVVLAMEGGYVDHPGDPGGATHRGITRATLARWRGHAVSKAQVRALSRDEAEAIYRALYWNAVGGDAMPPGIDLAVFDFAVNSGPGRAVRILQQELRVPADGAVGPVTLAAADRNEPALIVAGLCRRRLAFLRALPTWRTFGKGWSRRVAHVEREASDLARPSQRQRSGAIHAPASIVLP